MLPEERIYQPDRQSRAAKVEMTESCKSAIGIIVTGTPVPTLSAIIGTKLDLSEWICCSRIGMSVRSSSDKRINKVCESCDNTFFSFVVGSMNGVNVERSCDNEEGPWS